MLRALLSAALVAVMAAAVPAPGRADDRVDESGPASTAVHARGTRDVPELRVRQLHHGFRLPWDVRQLPSGALLVSERNRARLHLLIDGRHRRVEFPSDEVWVAVETGLMSLAVDPDFADNRRIYTCQGATTETGHEVRVVAWKLVRRKARHPEVLLGGIPALEGGHGGCRLQVDRDSGALLVGTGDGRIVDNARNIDTLGGKVLRLDRFTGGPWPQNPWYAEGGNRAYVFTFGHRNVQGLAQREDGTWWSVEQGTFRDDEVNRLRAGRDYGWDPRPDYNESSPMTDHTLPGPQVDARWTSGNPTVATSGAAWVSGEQWGDLDGTLAVAALKGQRLLFIKFGRTGDLRWVETPEATTQHGRLRSVTPAANGDLLVTTSNGGLDHVLRVSPR
jgi:aldose sugar dehydrogenase